jgi:hypothetical protein
MSQTHRSSGVMAGLLDRDLHSTGSDLRLCGPCTLRGDEHRPVTGCGCCLQRATRYLTSSEMTVWLSRRRGHPRKPSDFSAACAAFADADTVHAAAGAGRGTAQEDVGERGFQRGQSLVWDGRSPRCCSWAVPPLIAPPDRFALLASRSDGRCTVLPTTWAPKPGARSSSTRSTVAASWSAHSSSMMSRGRCL